LAGLQTEHLGAFWKDDFQPDASFHNPLFSRASPSTPLSTSRASRHFSFQSNPALLANNNNNNEARSRSPSPAAGLEQSGGGSFSRRNTSDAPRSPRSASISPAAAARAGAMLSSSSSSQPQGSSIREDEEDGEQQQQQQQQASRPSYTLGTREGDMNFILALPIVYVGEQHRASSIASRATFRSNAASVRVALFVILTPLPPV
jgi:hypothetical protein